MTAIYREYWTDHHAKELGLWDTSQDSVVGEQSDKAKIQQNQQQNDDAGQHVQSVER